MIEQKILRFAIAITVVAILALTPGLAQDDAPEPNPAPEQAESNEKSNDTALDGEMATEADQRAAEDAAVDEVLSEAELIYRDENEDGDFIPTEQVSADQSLDYPIDI